MEKKNARNWYWWLWLSPAVTVPTVIALYFSDVKYLVRNLVCPDRRCGTIIFYAIPIVTILFVSALWHLILLKPALNKESEFVRWHGWQALMLAGVRTIVPIGLVLWARDEEGVIPAIPILIVIWFFGTLWGQLQAARGDCSLMRWFGRGDMLPLPEPIEKSSQKTIPNPDALVDLIRFSNNQDQRRRALLELEDLGMVEDFDRAPASPMPSSNTISAGTKEVSSP